MEITKTNPQDYIKSLPEPKQTIIDTIDKAIRKALPKVERVMWEGKFWGGSEQKIIGYGQFTYKGSNKKEGIWFIVGLTAQKNYISVFVNGVEDKLYIAEKYKDTLGKVKVGKSSVSFTKLEEVNLDALIKLVVKAFDLVV